MGDGLLEQDGENWSCSHLGGNVFQNNGNLGRVLGRVPDDMQHLHPSLECCRLHIKKLGGSSRATHFPLSGVKGGKDMLTLSLFEGSDGMVFLVTPRFTNMDMR